MSKPATETRQHILDIAKALMAQKGYTSVGLAEVVAAAGVPKGSFYYYFKSKEEFGQALLEEYFSEYLARIDGLLTGTAPAAERLMAYFRYWKDTQCSDRLDHKCLVVKLAAEVCDLSEGMRAVLHRGTQAIVMRLATCVDQGHADGSIPSCMPSLALGAALYQLWLGASLMMKIGSSTEPFDTALDMTRRQLR